MAFDISSAGTQGAKVPEFHLRIRTIIFHIHGIVLATLHHAVLVGIPATFDPGKCEHLFDVGPVVFQEFIDRPKAAIPGTFS